MTQQQELSDGQYQWDWEFAIQEFKDKVKWAKFGYIIGQGLWINNPTRTIRIQTNRAGMQIFDASIKSALGSMEK